MSVVNISVKIGLQQTFVNFLLIFVECYCFLIFQSSRYFQNSPVIRHIFLNLYSRKYHENIENSEFSKISKSTSLLVKCNVSRFCYQLFLIKKCLERDEEIGLGDVSGKSLVLPKIWVNEGFQIKITVLKKACIRNASFMCCR